MDHAAQPQHSEIHSYYFEKGTVQTQHSAMHVRHCSRTVIDRRNLVGSLYNSWTAA